MDSHFVYNSLLGTTGFPAERHTNISRIADFMQRISYIDNLKGILIILVVIGHVLLPSAEGGGTPPYTTVMLYNSIYLFHMALFIFVSGFLAKHVYTPERGLNVNKILSLILLALIFHLCIILLDHGYKHLLSKTLNLVFASADWYLVALAWWYLLTPALSKMRPGPAIAIAICIGLLCGYAPDINKTLTLARTLSFLPFFVLGYYCSQSTLQKLLESKFLSVVAICALGFLVAYWVTNGQLIADIFPLIFGSKPYPGSEYYWLFRRLAVYAIALLLSLGVMRLTPQRENKVLSYLGKNTLQIYVLHRLLRSVLVSAGLYELQIVNDPVLGTLFLLFVSAILTAFCAIPLFNKPFNAILKIPWSKFLTVSKN